MTIERREWLATRAKRRAVDQRGRTFLEIRCPKQGTIRVRAMIVADGRPEARAKTRA